MKFFVALDVLMYNLQIRALLTLNGVLTLTDSGMLHSFNGNFIEALVGKQIKEQAENKFIVSFFFSY